MAFIRLRLSAFINFLFVAFCSAAIQDAGYYYYEHEKFEDLLFRGGDVFQTVSSKPYICISLGASCQCAYQLARKGLAGSFFPFDWMKTNDVDGLIKVLEDDFKEFINFNYLLDTKKPCVKNTIVQHTLYKIEFWHDFEMHSPLSKNFSAVQEKYLRRIERFKWACNSGKFIYFFRRMISSDQVKRLSVAIKDRWPELKCMIVALDETEEIKHDWQIPGVRNFFIKNPNPEAWQGDNAAWDAMLNALKLA